MLLPFVGLTGRPVDGEALDTFLERSAAANFLPLLEYLQAFGIEFSGGNVPAFWGVVVGDRLADQLDREFDIDSRSMTLQAFDQTALDLSGIDVDDTTSVRRLQKRAWVFLAGSRYCPTCLRDEGKWMNRWRLPFSLTCTSHRVWLESTCRGCERRPRTYSTTPTTRPAFKSRIASATRCMNRGLDGTNETGRGSLPCDFDFANFGSRPARGAVIEAQLHMERWPSAGGGQMWGVPATGLDLHQVLQTICVWLEHADGAERAARPWMTPPNRVDELAPGMVEAVRALRLPTVEDAASVLRPRLETLIDGFEAPQARLLDLVRWSVLAESLSAALVAPTVRVTTRLRPADADRSTSKDVDAESLLRILFEVADFDECRRIIDTVTGREILAEALAVDCWIAFNGGTHLEAVRDLGLPASSRRRVGYVHRLVNAADGRYEWVAEVQRLVSYLRAIPER